MANIPSLFIADIDLKFGSARLQKQVSDVLDKENFLDLIVGQAN